jgi:NAD+ kinase
VIWGGDGLMLESLHKFLNLGKPFYGIHSGSVGAKCRNTLIL